jgi:DNA ligase D
MLPTLASSIPKGENWAYEVKYDGFRCILFWDESALTMFSRNGHPLHEVFPDIPEFLKTKVMQCKPFFPLTMDGELCILENPYKASFEQIQKRGRLKTLDKIRDESRRSPSSLCVFDLIAIKGQDLFSEPFFNRKKILSNLMEHLEIPIDHIGCDSPLNFIPYYTESDLIEEKVKTFNGEGIVAKKLNSRWSPGIRTADWIKVKNLKKGVFILLGLDTENGFFHVGLNQENQVAFAGLFAHGITPEEKNALIHIVKNNESSRNGSFIAIEPSICVELSYLEMYKRQLRQPRFISFRLDVRWEDCTWESLQKNN